MPMPVDECNQTFDTLAAARLPAYFEQLQQSLDTPLEAAFVQKRGNGHKKILQRLDKVDDFSGCYVFVEREEPLYVGISRGVVGRLIQHLKSQDHFSGSLAYFMAKRQHNPHDNREANMQDRQFRRLFGEAQSRLGGCLIGTVEIDNPVELHLFEVYAAMELQTGEFNTFRTH